MERGEVILLAFDATKDITGCALEWAVSNVTKARDSLILLALLPSPPHPKPPTKHALHRPRMSHFLSCLMNKCHQGKNPQDSFSADHGLRLIEEDLKNKIQDVCLSMIYQLRSAHNVAQVHTEVKIMVDAQPGSVAMKAKELEATRVILDRCLKNEVECCMKNLKCNMVVMDNAIPKVLRAESFTSSTTRDGSDGQKDIPEVADELSMLHISKPDSDDQKARSQGCLYLSSNNNALFSSCSIEGEKLHQTSPSSMKTKSTGSFLNLNSQNFDKGLETGACFSPSPYAAHEVQKLDVLEPSRKSFVGQSRAPKRALAPRRRSTDLTGWLRKSETMTTSNQGTTDIRNAISIPPRNPPMALPRCSICKHNVPSMVNCPRKFSHKDIEKATNGFSLGNLLGGGSYGSVYGGVLADGQVIAVKQHKTLSEEGVSEFFSKIEVLSCAQHRNLVALVGYCIEKTWLLVYEFACNGSLDQHLYGGRDSKEVMAWQNRMKVAVGAARGLSYLHEDCRVGCIVHRDFRPNNILLTHDFEAMVGDFGLARWRVDDQSTPTEETQLFGAFGYLAPEYMRTRFVTEKADIYSFGVVLLELISGSKATDLSRKIGQEFELGLPLRKRMSSDELIDPGLEKNYVKEEVERMIYAASLCILPHAEQRPRMSKIVMTLEGASLEDGLHVPFNYPIKYMNHIFGSDTPSAAEHPRGQVHSLKHGAYMNDGGLTEICTSYNGLERSATNLSDDFEAYLRGSLVKFIQNTN